ncbi:hypothetical protein Tco_0867830 [Tanacetum coccineum]
MSLSMAENVIVAWADNRPPMLDKTLYSSWAIHMLLYIKGKENRKLLVDSVLNRPFKYGTVIVPGTQTTPATVQDKTYDELTYAEKLHDSYDIKATNIVLQGSPQDIYNMERESNLYDEFDMFTSVPGETILSYNLRIVLDEVRCILRVNGDIVTIRITPPSANDVLMAKLSLYDLNILLDVPIHDNYLDNHVLNQSVQELLYSKQPVFNTDTNTAITSDSNMISYDKYLKETKNMVVQDTSSSAQNDAMIMTVIEEMSNQVAKCNEVYNVNKAVNESLTAELERYKEQTKLFKEIQQFDLNDREKYIDGQLIKVIVDKNVKVTDFEN